MMGTASELRKTVIQLTSGSPGWEEDLLKEVPTKWTIHGNLALLPPSSFTSPFWELHPPVYETVARLLKVQMIARHNGPIRNPDYRQPSISLLFNPDNLPPTPRKRENGIYYTWDLTKVMFSPGNISEKLRLSCLDLRGQTVVDLYAGIGYFSLTFLIHAQASFLYACEWNPDALTWLEANLQQNKVDPGRYTILPGDNRLTAPKGVADHVNLGLIPSSEAGWEVAAAALKPETGGILHIHGNVDILDKNEDKTADILPSWGRWSQEVKSSFDQIFRKLYPDQEWRVEVVAVVKVKSYGPQVHHLVVDLSCKPVKLLPTPINTPIT